MNFLEINENGNVFLSCNEYTIHHRPKGNWNYYDIYRGRHFCLTVHNLETAKQICEIMINDFLAHRPKKKVKKPGQNIDHIFRNRDKLTERHAIMKQMELVGEIDE